MNWQGKPRGTFKLVKCWSLFRRSNSGSHCTLECTISWEVHNFEANEIPPLYNCALQIHRILFSPRRCQMHRRICGACSCVANSTQHLPRRWNVRRQTLPQKRIVRSLRVKRKGRGFETYRMKCSCWFCQISKVAIPGQRLEHAGVGIRSSCSSKGNSCGKIDAAHAVF